MRRRVTCENCGRRLAGWEGPDCGVSHWFCCDCLDRLEMQQSLEDPRCRIAIANHLREVRREDHGDNSYARELLKACRRGD